MDGRLLRAEALADLYYEAAADQAGGVRVVREVGALPGSVTSVAAVRSATHAADRAGIAAFLAELPQGAAAEHTYRVVASGVSLRVRERILTDPLGEHRVGMITLVEDDVCPGSTNGRLRALLDAVAEHPYSLEVSPQGAVLRVVDASPTIGRLLGSGDLGVFGYAEFVAHVHPDDRVGDYPPEALASGRWEQEVRLRGLDGITRTVWDRAVRRPTETGPDEPAIWDGVLVDISQLRQRERGACTILRRLDAALAAVGSGLIEIQLRRGRPARLVFAGETTADVLGHDCERGPLTLEWLAEALLPSDRPLLDRHLAELRERHAISAEYRLLGDDGRLRVVQIRLVPRIEAGAVLARGILTCATPSNGAPETAGEVALTARQLEVLALVADGLRTKEIADRLTISPITVRHHVTALLAALGARSRLEAVTAARRRGLI
jgi:DNA-binding CsgD family transcriptional regulator/DNA-binding transcriptional ArsR family regulator